MPKFFFAILFFASLELSYFFKQTNFWFLGVIAALITVLLIWKFFKKFEFFLAAALHTLSSLIFLHFLHSLFVSQLAILVLSGFFYLLFKRNTFASLASLFVFLLPIIYWQLEFNFSVFLASVSVFLFSVFLFFSSFSLSLGAGELLKLRLFYFSLVAAFVLAELYFVLSNFPFNIISMDFLLVVVYYLFLDFVVLYFSRKLTKAAFAKNIFFTAISFLFILFSARWFPN